MPGCCEVKAILRWNWLKIDIWDLQTPYINGMYLVSLDPLGPYPKFGSKRAWWGRSQIKFCYLATLPATHRLETIEQLLTVVQWIDGVYHELEQSVPEVAAGVQDGNVGGPPPRVLARHHARHGRARHARLEFRVGFHKTTFGGYQN